MTRTVDKRHMSGRGREEEGGREGGKEGGREGREGGK